MRWTLLWSQFDGNRLSHHIVDNTMPIFDCTLDGDVKALSRTISVMSYDIMKLNLNTYENTYI
jgi:hypothetical protein